MTKALEPRLAIDISCGAAHYASTGGPVQRVDKYPRTPRNPKKKSGFITTLQPSWATERDAAPRRSLGFASFILLSRTSSPHVSHGFFNLRDWHTEGMRRSRKRWTARTDEGNRARNPRAIALLPSRSNALECSPRRLHTPRPVLLLLFFCLCYYLRGSPTVSPEFTILSSLWWARGYSRQTSRAPQKPRNEELWCHDGHAAVLDDRTGHAALGAAGSHTLNILTRQPLFPLRQLLRSYASGSESSAHMSRTSHYEGGVRRRREVEDRVDGMARRSEQVSSEIWNFQASERGIHVQSGSCPQRSPAAFALLAPCWLCYNTPRIDVRLRRLGRCPRHEGKRLNDGR